MRKPMGFILFFQILSLSFTSCTRREVTPSITVYTYDSFAQGLGPVVAKAFLRDTGIPTRLVSFGSCGEALNQIVLEGTSTPADLLVGIDSSLVARALESHTLVEAPHAAAKLLPDSTWAPDLWLDSRRAILPFDYGYLAFVYDSRRTSPQSDQTLAAFAADVKWKSRVVIEDPRTSSIGLSFLEWTRSSYTETDWKNFWQKMSHQLVTIAPGWSSAYGLFLKKEADWVLSYTTSPAYHIEKEQNPFIHALLFKDGHYRQVEGAATVKVSTQQDLAERWLSTLLSAEVQSKVATKQWMYPVRSDVALPASFLQLVVPKPVQTDAVSSRQRREWIQKWVSIAAQLP